jgi:hypothetical protein
MWLGISALELSDPRRVLGLPAGPVDPVTVMARAEQRLAHLRSVQAGAYEQARIALLAHVEQARDAVLAQASARQPAIQSQPRFAMPPPPPGVARAAGVPGTPAAAPPPYGQALPASGHGYASPDAAAPQPELVLRDRPPRRRRESSGMEGLLFVILVALAGVAGVGAMLYLQRGGDGGRKEVAMGERPGADEEPQARRPADTAAAPARPGRGDDTAGDTGPPPGPGPLDSLPDTGMRKPDRLPDPPPAGRGPPPREPRGDRAVQPVPMPQPADPPREREPQAMPTAAAPEAAVMTEDGKGKEKNEAGPVVDAAVEKVFEALLATDFDAAEGALRPALEARKDRGQAERVDGWQLLIEYAKGFEDYRRQAVAAVKAGNEYSIPKSKGDGEMMVGIVDVADGKILFRVEGQTLERPLEKIPSNLLSAIVEDWFDDNPANSLYLGAYHLTRPEPDLRAAERLWSSAALRGADAAPLLPLLEESVIRRAAAGE